MKKKSKVLICVLAAIVAGILLSIPVSLFFDETAMASSDVKSKEVTSSTSVDEAGEEYIFVVLDETKVPLAALPKTTSYSGYVFVAVIISLLFVGVLCYTYWYFIVKKNISHYSKLVTKSELKNLLPTNGFLHPRKLAYAEREVESLAAKRYI